MKLPNHLKWPEPPAAVDKRHAATPEPPPTGDDAIVMNYVAEKLDSMVRLASLPTALPPLTKAEHILALLSDLAKRAEFGKAKYGTYLRIYNGRDCSVDLYQELQDAVMYAGQAHLERKPGGELFELLVQLASNLAGALNARR